MTEREEKRREEEYPYTDIRIRREFYIPTDFQQTFIELGKILNRENKSLSEWVRDHAVDYVRLHAPGNPQQRLDTIAKTGQAYRAPLVCACGRRATRKNTLNNGEIVWSCNLHAPAKERVRMWKPIK